MREHFIQGSRYLWRIPDCAPDEIAAISSAYNLSMPIANTLLSRGLTTKAEIDAFLFTSRERDVPHPSLMKDALLAVERIERAIAAHESILVAGDYDVDGVTSSALMLICLLPLGAQINFFLPNRVRDGYGLSTNVVERAARNNYKVLITVDNGITAFEPAKRARELGIDLIITDHHRPHDELPDAYAIINPAQDACEYPFKSLAGVGVTFKVLSLLYERRGLEMPAKAYELLLLGTVADVVPLRGENRFWVREGLCHINKVESMSLKALKQNGKLSKPKLTSLDIGFSIAPQINALGRLDDPRSAVKFLIGSDEREVEQVARVLLEMNEARKKVERTIFEDVVAQINDKRIDLDTENVIIAVSRNWLAGVIGLVASKLVGAYGRPTILLHLTHDGILKGSCRSIEPFNMFDALHDAKDLLLQFGGHAQAAGLSLVAANLPALKEHLEARVSAQLTAFDLTKKLVIDASVQLGDLGQKFMTDMEHLSPFGHKNSVPTFYIESVALVQPPTLLKEAHVKCMISADGIVKPTIFFNRPELYQMLIDTMGEPFSLAAQVAENHWQGRVSVELQGIDVAFNETKKREGSIDTPL